jgi:hypothetical protein
LLTDWGRLTSTTTFGARHAGLSGPVVGIGSGNAGTTRSDTVLGTEFMARGMARPRWRWGLISLAAIVALGVGGCDDHTDAVSPRSGDGVASASSGPDAPKAPTRSDVPASPPVLADGRHAAYLTGLDVGKRTLTFDKIDFLTGEAAKKAYLKENPGETDGPPNDYMIVNDNPLLRTLPIADAATITIVDLTSGALKSKETTLGALPAYFASEKGGKQLWHDPFWLTVKRGQITRIEEQFLP